METLENLSLYNQLKQKHKIEDTTDYDLMDGIIDTKQFTIIDNVEIIDENHPFIPFLNGFTHHLFNTGIIHGWHHKPSNTVKLIVKKPDEIGNVIYVAWQKYLKNKEEEISNVYIYSISRGKINISNEYKKDKHIFYDNFIKKLIYSIC